MLTVPTGSSFAGPFLVTFAYFILWYCLLFLLQRQTKYRLQREYLARGEIFDRYFGQDSRMLAADRVVINTQEQMVPFLFALWLHAIFVATFSATLLGCIYVLLRSAYPFLLGQQLAYINPKKVYFVTFPCYGIIFYFLISVVYKILTIPFASALLPS